MRLYHGTTVKGLDILRANSRDKNGNPVLYLTDNRAYSLFYIREREIDFVTCGVGAEGIVHYDEKIPNQLELLYQGKTGYVYEVEADAEPTKINGIYVTSQDTKITAVTYIPEAYGAICNEIRKGNVEILHYEELTEEQRRLNEEGIRRWLQSEQRMHPKKEMFLRTHFPAAWAEAQNALAQMNWL